MTRPLASPQPWWTNSSISQDGKIQLTWQLALESLLKIFKKAHLLNCLGETSQRRTTTQVLFKVQLLQQQQPSHQVEEDP